MARKNTKAKGGNYEREICKKLSLWWTDGNDDDVFWRTASSGGRATQRAKKNKSTFGNHGDLQAVNPIGQPLIDAFAVEIKRGYPAAHVGDHFDKPSGTKASPFELFVHQAATSAKGSGSRYWMLIHKRDRRNEIVYLPLSALIQMNCRPTIFSEYLLINSESLRRYSGIICGLPLDNFLKKVTRKKIMRLV